MHEVINTVHLKVLINHNAVPSWHPMSFIIGKEEMSFPIKVLEKIPVTL